MKKLMLYCFVFLLLSGCAQSPAVSNTSDINASGVTATSEVTESRADNSVGDYKIADTERTTLLDMPMFRGTVTEILPEDGVYKLMLKSQEGADFGYPSIMMQTGENTRADFPLEELAVDNFLEVYYDERNNGLPPVIIAANLLPPADVCVYNGELVKSDENGRLEMKPLSGGDVTIFNFDESTRFYLDKNSIVPGVKLNLFHRGALTRSIPPQGFAYEVRPYKET